MKAMTKLYQFPFLNTAFSLRAHVELLHIACRSLHCLIWKMVLLSIPLLALPLAATGQEDLQGQSFIVRNNDTVAAIISKREITRLSFESDIAFISSVSGELEYTTKDHDLYLRPLVEKPINFFVRTADDNTYKFLLDASDIPATQIFIKSNQQQSITNKLVQYGRYNISEALQKKISKLIDISLKPQKHLGFKFTKTNDYLGTISDILMKKTAEVEGFQLRAEIIILTNESDELKKLNLNEFLDDQAMAVYVVKQELNAGEQTKLIRVKG